MVGRGGILAVVVIAVVLVGSFSVYEAYFAGPGNPCGVIPGGSIAKVQTAETRLGAVTEYLLPSPDRYPNAVTSAPDGSVWFAEDEVPGVGHLFPNNGTVVEYAWPGYTAPQPPDCIGSVSVSGIALWNGRVWGADEFGNAIVGVNPADGKSVSLNTSAKADYPYWLAVGPDGDLWFTSDNTPARIGRIAPNMSMQIINLSGVGQDEPLTLVFVNSTLGYISAVNLSTTPSNPTCVCKGHIYSFDPAAVSPTIAPTVVGSGFELVLPTSVAYLRGSLWVAQHDASNLAEYNLSAGTWTTWPTSTVGYSRVTLPLVTQAAGGEIWFNEHYANKIARINPAAGTLTEYSESTPPASNFSEVQNDLSIAAVDGGAWFTSLSGNYVGFADGNYAPGWSLASSEGRRVSVAPGGSASFDLRVSGAWADPLKVTVSDSENLTSAPSLIRVTPSVSSLPSGSASYDLGVNVSVASAVRPGIYAIAVTLTGGLTQQSVYLFVSVQ